MWLSFSLLVLVCFCASQGSSAGVHRGQYGSPSRYPSYHRSASKPYNPTCNRPGLMKYLGVYKRVISIVVDGVVGDLSVSPKKFRDLHACIGNTKDEDILHEGRSFLQYLYDFFGIDFRNMPDEFLINGKKFVHKNGKLNLQTVFFDPEVTKERVVNEVKIVNNKVQTKVYKNNPVSLFGWAVGVEGTYPVAIKGPMYSGILNPGDNLLQKHFFFFTDMDGYRKTVVLRFRSEIPSRGTTDYLTLQGALLSEELGGEGSGIGLFVVDGKVEKGLAVNGRGLLTFPPKV